MGRSLEFTEEDLVLLAKVWVTISEDPKIGTDQSSAKLMERIARLFDALRPGHNRTPKSLLDKYYELSSQCSKFSGYYNSCKRIAENTSGENLEQVLSNAHDMYTMKKSKPKKK